MDRKAATKRYIEIVKSGKAIFANPELESLMPLVDMQELEIELGTGISNWNRPNATILPYPHRIIFPDSTEDKNED